MSDRNGKIFCTSIASLSHISKEPGHEAAHGRRRCCTYRNHPCAITFRLVRLRRAYGIDSRKDC
nr:hypothetical protein [Eubacterium sp. am_0171]